MARSTLAAPHAPRLDELGEVAELRPGDLLDDAVVSGLRCAGAAADFHSCEFVELGASEILGGTLADSQWYRSSWYDLRLSRVDLASSRHEETGWRRVELLECRASGLDVAQGVLSDVTFRDCVVDVANFRFSQLTRVRFIDCRLRGADFGSARLTDVLFDGCDLSDTDVHQMRSQRVLITGCTLDGLRSVAGLAGVHVEPLDLLQFSAQLADALNIRLGPLEAE